MHNKKSLTYKFVLFCSFFIVSNLFAQEYSNIQLIEKETFEQIIKQREGKPLFINLWATWCVPCREEFPTIIALKEKYKDKVDFIAISVDYPDEIESKINPFISDFEINFPIYVNNFKKEEDLINYLNKDWFGSLPATFIYDGNGVQKFFINGKEEYDFFSTKLEELLKK